ncbi:MAG: B12-binding domain-containing radical SAM protein [Deltaproteobacteria bacterium]|nr:B12-binding domain-containing radical SAM protein [Deltaproteobacteria bacterium]
MKVVLISMPDVVPIIIHEMAIHMPNHGIACIGGNIDAGHEVYLIDLVRKRNSISAYLTKTLKKIKPDLIGLSAMTWQYPTCLALIGLIKHILPRVKIAVGGYHATLMHREMTASPESQNVDFIVRGEGEEAFRRLVNALAGTDRLDAVPSLSYKRDGQWVHNEQCPLCDLSRLKPPIRDRRRLTSGYHFMYSRIEVMETSRGCTRNCSFCSINHMYGRSYRTYPIERILADLDDIYFNRKTKLIFITDDNMVLNPKWVMNVCDAIIQRNYKNLHLVVQADCISMACNEAMVEKMAQAGFRTVFLGIENASSQNLRTMEKADVVKEARRAVENCQRNGIMVIGGLIFGLPDDDEEAIRRNYQFLIDLEVDASYCQMLSPFPKTKLREHLISEGLVVNTDHYERYNGLWANVKTRHLDADQLQYAFWHARQTVLGWWKPSTFVTRQGRLWTSIWMYLVKPVMKFFVDRQIRKIGWEGRYQRDIHRLERMNHFDDLQAFMNDNNEHQAGRRAGGGVP